MRKKQNVSFPMGFGYPCSGVIRSQEKSTREIGLQWRDITQSFAMLLLNEILLGPISKYNFPKLDIVHDVIIFSFVYIPKAGPRSTIGRAPGS